MTYFSKFQARSRKQILKDQIKRSTTWNANSGQIGRNSQFQAQWDDGAGEPPKARCLPGSDDRMKKIFVVSANNGQAKVNRGGLDLAVRQRQIPSGFPGFSH